MKFFVYGTLKVGGRFAERFDSLRVNSMPASVEGFHLFDLGSFPGILPGNGVVYGELHEYGEDVTRAMDTIEGYRSDDEDNSLYLRREVEVTTATGKTDKASIYIFNRKDYDDSKMIESGVWKL